MTRASSYRSRAIVLEAVKSRSSCVEHRSCEIIVRRHLSSSSTMSDKFKLPARYGTGEPSVWVEYAQFAADHKIQANLGQGFPNFHAPKHVTQALADIALDDNPLLHQYARGYGHPKLVQNLSKLFSPLIGVEINPMNEILITSGAYEALYSTILGHVDVGDEVIIIEPFFDCYNVMVEAAGGTCRYIPLKPKSKGNLKASDWVLDKDQLASMFNSTTKMILMNTPHNPLGKVFSREEIEFIGGLCKKHDVMYVSDEVYEWLVYEPHQHVRAASLPGMWDRTITIGSFGKTYSLTGWKTGWAYGPAKLLKNLQAVHQNCVYTCCTPVQEALARALDIDLARRDSPDMYMKRLPVEIEAKREMLCKTLVDVGFDITVPDGGYFIVADWSKLADKIDLSSEKDKYKDIKFTKKLAKESSVLAIPPSFFYSLKNKNLGENYVRFCFIKKDENLQLADKLLKEWYAKK